MGSEIVVMNTDDATLRAASSVSTSGDLVRVCGLVGWATCFRGGGKGGYGSESAVMMMSVENHVRKGCLCSFQVYDRDILSVVWYNDDDDDDDKALKSWWFSQWLW